MASNIMDSEHSKSSREIARCRYHMKRLQHSVEKNMALGWGWGCSTTSICMTNSNAQGMLVICRLQGMAWSSILTHWICLDILIIWKLHNFILKITSILNGLTSLWVNSYPTVSIITVSKRCQHENKLNYPLLLHLIFSISWLIRSRTDPVYMLRKRLGSNTTTTILTTVVNPTTRQ